MGRDNMASRGLQHVDLLGIHVSVVNPESAAERVEQWVNDGVKTYVCVSDAHLLVRASRAPELAEVMNNAGMVLPDGQPLVWAGRYAGAEGMARTSGPDFFPALMAKSREHGWRHFLLGGAPGVVESLKERFEQQYPGVAIVGLACPPFRPATEQEDAALVEQINQADPHFVWVGLGAPKQEMWIRDHRDRLGANVLFGVGAAFDFSAGTVARAPEWMQRVGLEWFFRMTQEPKRLFPRYAYTIPRLALGVVRRRPKLLPASE